MKREIIRLKEVDSTSNYLKEQADVDEDSIVVAVAEYQTAGRGQATNRWESEQGKNLTFSILTNPRWLPLRRQFLLSMAGALALKASLDKYTDGITLKWPNDIYWNDKKISGTLIETTISGKELNSCIFGIGLNVNQEVFKSDAPNPISLYNIINKVSDREVLLNEILDCFEKYYAQLRQGEYDTITALYHSSLYRRTGLHEFSDANGTFMAEIKGVKENGHLIVKDTNNNIREYELKEIKYGKI